MFRTSILPFNNIKRWGGTGWCPPVCNENSTFSASEMDVTSVVPPWCPPGAPLVPPWCPAWCPPGAPSSFYNFFQKPAKLCDARSRRLLQHGHSHYFIIYDNLCCRRNTSQSDQIGKSFLLQLENVHFQQHNHKTIVPTILHR
jgi:hypothetical protein